MPGQCKNTTMLEFMERRRSVLARELGPPGPPKEDIAQLLKIAARVPDHGKLVPWRFVVIDGTARRELGRITGEIARRENPSISGARL